eukprot:s5222_g3.t1
MQCREQKTGNGKRALAEAQYYDRIDGLANQVGFVAQQVEASGPWARACELKKFEDRELMTLDYQRMTAVLWQALGLLEQLARDFNVRDPRGPAQRRGEADSGRSSHRSPELAPGKSFSQNTRGANKYGLVVTDVFRREVATKALPDKRTRAVAEIIPDLVEEEGDYVVTTDLGNERDHVDKAAEAYNARPHQAVRVAPEDVETMPAASFRVYRDHAQKFKRNDELTRSRQRRLEEAGAFRASTIPAPVVSSYDPIGASTEACARCPVAPGSPWLG